MNRFTDEHLLFRECLRSFIEKEITPFVAKWEEERGFPARELYKKLGDEGHLGLICPEEYGGLGLDFWYEVIWIEELGRIEAAGLPMSLTVQTDIVSPIVEKWGSEALKRRFLAPAIAGDAIGALAISEPGAGSDLSAIGTVAREEGASFVINGRKAYVTNGSIADFVVTLCRCGTDPGTRRMSLIVVPRDTPGLSAHRKYEASKLGNYCCDHAELSYNDVAVSRENLIGSTGAGWDIQARQFQHERLIEAILACSQATSVLETTRAYARTRRVFGQPLIEHQSVAFRLVDLETEVELLRQMAYHTVDLFVHGRECMRETAMLKLKAGRLIREVTDECLHLLGAHGYLENAGMSRRLRDLRAAALTGGSIEVMQRILTKFL